MSRRRIAFIFLTFFSLAFRAGAQQQFEIAGSDMLLSFGTQLSKVYRQRFPQSEITVKGGSDTAQVMNNDLHAVVQTHGSLVAPARYVFPVAIEEITIYVHPSNPVKELTINQLRGIFRGDIVNWKDIGGPDARIDPYGADNTTGLLNFFTQAVLKGEDSDSFVGKANTKAMLEMISSDPGAIGFGIYDPDPRVAMVALKGSTTTEAIPPTIGNFRWRVYPLTRQI